MYFLTTLEKEAKPRKNEKKRKNQTSLLQFSKKREIKTDELLEQAIEESKSCIPVVVEVPENENPKGRGDLLEKENVDTQVMDKCVIEPPITKDSEKNVEVTMDLKTKNMDLVEEPLEQEV